MASKHNEVAPDDRQKNGAGPNEVQEDSANCQDDLLDENVADQADTNNFLIVGLGASAGGLEAFEQFFTQMPPDSGMAFVLVQHLDPTHDSILVELIKRFTRMPVLQVRDGMAVESNHVYVIPPNREMALSDLTLHLTRPAQRRGFRLPIDAFFRSLANDQKDKAICIVLSGTGSDGTLGLRAIKGEGGMAMVQEPGTAKYDGMPTSAVATGLADYVLPPEQLPEQLLNYVQHAFKPGSTGEEPPLAEGQQAQARICELLRRRTGHDFSGYKPNTIGRRIERRLAVSQTTDIEAYVQLLQETPAEVETLFRQLLIGVTSFFRDPAAFKLLEQKVIPQLIEKLPAREPLRVWTPGCATGEEAYSLAILIQEQLEQSRREVEVQIFATDIDNLAIEKARAGIYPANIAADIEPERLRRFFGREGNSYQVSKRIRDMVVFAVQSLIKDPPFSRLDLISCRNLLIYLGPGLQQRVIPLFHYALKPEGYLFLGNSESLGKFDGHFIAVNRKWKIFQRPKDGAPLRAAMNFTGPTQPDSFSNLETPLASLGDLTQKLLLEEHTPACVVVDERGDIHYLHGRTGPYLEPAAGEPTMNVLRMARQGLRMPLTTALRRTASRSETVIREQVAVKTNGERQSLKLTVKPLQRPAAMRGLMLVLFEEVTPPGLQAEAGGQADGDESPGVGVDRRDRRIAELEQELATTREYLQTTVEELETTNEELQSSNEELQSSNEELQSTNEELETSKEELQSINEELVTVNSELQKKIEELTEAHDDISNLVDSVPVGIIFLDRRLQIERFNPPAAKLFNLIDGDLGRPIRHLDSNLDYGSIVADCNAVLDILQIIETEVQSRAGRWHLVRIQPYRTLAGAIDGLVLTFADITLQKEMQAELEQHRQHLEELVEARTEELAEKSLALDQILASTSDHIYIFDRDVRYLYASQSGTEALGLDHRDVVGRTWRELNLPEDKMLPYEAQVHQVIETGKPLRGETEFPTTAGSRYYEYIVTPLRDPAGAINYVLNVSRDITERKQAEEELRQRAEEFRALAENNPDLIARFDRELRHLYVNPAVTRAAGISFEQYIGAANRELGMPEELVDFWDTEINRVFETGQENTMEFQYTTVDGPRYLQARLAPEFGPDGAVATVLSIVRDLTDQKEVEESLREANAHITEILQSVSDAFFSLDDELTVNYFNRMAERTLNRARDEVMGRNLFEAFPEAKGSIFEEKYRQAIREKERMTFETYFDIPPYQNWYEVNVYPRANGISVYFQVVTERKQAEEALRENEAQLARAQEIARLGSWRYDVQSQQPTWSAEMFRMFGLDPAQGAPDYQTHRNYIHPDDWERFDAAVTRAVTQGEGYNLELRLVQPGGDIRTVVAKCEAQRGENGQIVQLIGTTQDITASKQVELQLRTALEEKEVLLRELYHRTKNNMAVISAMLELQASYLEDDKLLAAFQETQNRIQTMALVHQMLYQSQDLTHINLGDYVGELAHLLMDSYAVLPDRINLALNTAEVTVLVDTAISCGLILNELISNALKHAFPEDRAGQITIELSRPTSREILLRVSDNGVGVPEDFDFSQSDSLGLLTVFAVGERQLKGEVTFEANGGVSCQVRFSDNRYTPRI